MPEIDFPSGGVEVCLPVPTVMYEARRFREMALLYHDGNEWSDISTAPHIKWFWRTRSKLWRLRGRQYPEVVGHAGRDSDTGFTNDHDFGGDYAGKLCAAGRTATGFRDF